MTTLTTEQAMNHLRNTVDRVLLRYPDLPLPVQEALRSAYRDTGVEQVAPVQQEGDTILVERNALRCFAQDVMKAWPEGDLDGGVLQDTAVEHGLLREETRRERCGEICHCAENVTEMEFYAGVVCYRKTPLLTGTAIASTNAGAKEKA